MNAMNGKIQDLQNAQSFDTKHFIAMDLASYITGCIQNYTDYSREDYKNYIEYQTQYANDPEYNKFFQVNINSPYRRYYPDWDYQYINPRFLGLIHPGGAQYFRIECTLASFTMKNPNLELPFSYEGLEYLKKLYITRLSTNSYIETEEAILNKYNSRTVLTYLNTNNSYIEKLRNEINQAYLNINQELIKTKSNINGSEAGIFSTAYPSFWSATNPAGTVKEIWGLYLLTVIAPMTQAPLGNPYAAGDGGVGPYDSPIVFEDGFIWHLGQTIGDRGIPDRWNHQPYFSSYPQTNGGGSQSILNDFPYSPSIQLGSNEVIEFTKPVNDVNFLNDAVSSIDLYYKSKTNKLQEFAASLAALEIQLALYLDDEDYKQYNPDYVQ